MVKIDIFLEKNNFIPLEKIRGRFKYEKKLDYTKLHFVLVQVYDWFDETVRLDGSGKYENGSIKFEIANGLERGLYTILCIKDDEGNILIGKENDNLHPLVAFTILSLSEKNSMQLYSNIYNIRENKYNRPKFRIDDKNAIPFDVYIFCKNIKNSVVAQYDDVQIFPYEYLKLTSEVDYINSFYKDIINLQLTVKNEKFNSSIPSAVFRITNIMALNYEEAEEYAIKKVDILNNIFTTLLWSHGTYFSIVTLNKKEHMSKINMLETRYKGNLLLFAEQGFNIKHYYEYLNRENSYLTVYMKLLNEARNEENRMLQYYRYWNVLEGIASLKNYEDEVMKKWDGTVVYNKIGDELKIGGEALNNVFELVRENFKDTSEDLFINNLDNINTVKEFLGICYQRRNCCVHRGECYCHDETICLECKRSMKLCKNSNIIHNEEPIQFRDRILRKLEEISFRIVLNELTRKAGNVVKEKNYINELLN